jgi:outer membrane protein TolC
MKKLLLGYAFFIISTHFSFGQSTNFQALSLKDAVQYALTNHPQLANVKIDQEILKAKMWAAKANNLPQINGGAAISFHPSLQKVFFQPNLFLPNNTDNNVNAGSLQTPYGGFLQVNASQLLFNGTYLIGTKAVELYTELNSKNQQQTEAEITRNVSKAYYTVLMNQERLGLIEANIQRLTEALKDTEAAFQNGIAEKLDVDKITVLLNNAKIEKEKFLQINDLGVALLKFQLNAPQEQNINVTGKLADFIADISNQTAENNNPLSFEVLALQKKIQEVEIKTLQAGYYPSAYLFGTLGANTGTTTLGGVFNPTNWYNFSAVGLRLQVPIFDGLLKKHQIQEKKLQLQKLANQEILLKNATQLQQKQALTNLKNAQLNLQMHEQHIKLATEILRVAKVKYKEGTNSNLDLLNAATALKEAEMNYQQAMYECLLADLELKK